MKKKPTEENDEKKNTKRNYKTKASKSNSICTITNRINGTEKNCNDMQRQREKWKLRQSSGAHTAAATIVMKINANWEENAINSAIATNIYVYMGWFCAVCAYYSLLFFALSRLSSLSCSVSRLSISLFFCLALFYHSRKCTLQDAFEEKKKKTQHTK